MRLLRELIIVMAKTRDIQRRIKSIGNTRKITKAMEMVSAAKMRKAVEAVLRTRTYANLSWATVLNVSRAINNSGGNLHPLLSKRKEIKRVAIVLIASNRGLCGGFNSAVVNKAHESIQKHHYRDGKMSVEADIVLVGSKGEVIYRYYGYNIAAEFPKADLANQTKEISPIATMVLNDFINKKYDKIMVAYTDYVSAIKQVPRVKQLLPIDISISDDYLGIVGQDSRLKLDKEFIDRKEKKHSSKGKFNYEYIFEPNPQQVLDQMIPRLIEVQLLQAVLESNASEHSARMAAMHQANEAAGDLVEELTLFYNKARQASITSELAEISAGASALN